MSNLDRRIVTIHVSGRARLSGYRYWWVKGVKGFNPKEHCAMCLLGPFLGNWKEPGNFPMHKDVPLPLAPGVLALYICGVSFRGYDNNFHLPLMQDDKAPGFDIPMIDGQTMHVEGAHRLGIPPLEKGAYGKPAAFTTCRNFQWAAAYFGIDDSGRPKQATLEL